MKSSFAYLFSAELATGLPDSFWIYGGLEIRSSSIVAVAMFFFGFGFSDVSRLALAIDSYRVVLRGLVLLDIALGLVGLFLAISEFKLIIICFHGRDRTWPKLSVQTTV